VWLAIREGGIANTQLAVKLPHRSRVDVNAIRQEARVWAQIGSHPHVVPIFEADVYDGQIVIASEYCPDGSLADWLKQHGGKAPSLGAAAELLLGILAGLEHLHRQGIVHRDIKPANILLSQGVPRLADFGMSRFLTTQGAPSVMGGTPAFMAPEAFDGVRSIATDLWSVGVLAQLLLTGTLPFPERDWTALFKAIVTRDPLPLPGDIPEAMRAVVRLSLEKDARRRLAAAGQMADMIRAAGLGTRGPEPPVRLAVHIAAFFASTRVALFINATNLSPTLEREVTHIWVEAEPRIHVMNDKRPLPKRLKPQETWETWIALQELPPQLLLEDRLHTHVRARLSTGEIISADINESVPEEGFIPGATPAAAEQGPSASSREETKAPKRRAWWKFW
jgi:serine/threonine protein kinase